MTISTVSVVGEVKELTPRYDNTSSRFQSGKELQLLRLMQNLTENYLVGVEAIGAGYDVFGDYASASSITYQLFDWKKDRTNEVLFKKGTVVPQSIDVQQQDLASYRNFSGSKISTYQDELSASAKIEGAYNLFSASVSNDFNSSCTRNAEYEFSRIQQSIELWSLKVKPDYSALRHLLFENVRTAIDNATDKAAFNTLFRTYGSHFLTGMIVGGRAVFSSSTNKVSVDKTFSNETAAQATYQGLTGQLSSEAKLKYSTSISSFQENSESKNFVQGGDAIAASKVFSGDKTDFNAWTDTIATSPDLIDITHNSPFTGIWELCKDNKQKQDMQNYFEQEWGPDESKKRQILASYIDSLIVIYGKSSTIVPPLGYTKIPNDLNKGAGGKFIYLCYSKYTPKSTYDHNMPDCISDITTIVGENASAPDGYTKIDIDLNMGAGGKYIYLCYKKEKYNDEIAIKDVTVISGSNSDLQPPYGFTKVQQDLNEGAGGDFIYICFSRDA
ncbi:MACPF domain-containing protein [Vibrio porteresiae]|uniref:MACPF domain-containing protein n=1 Tax=Vibrio porteresiae DSM 19223 TaxID=1123496 RepID=A0ABZ0QA61_9VIBR|nr:MACPF domain-containing protein [Vibrio porteresiae]WPC72667.1 MACPF domain-containing protein [Vibrio porteresiae DSM 19223]